MAKNFTATLDTDELETAVKEWFISNRRAKGLTVKVTSVTFMEDENTPGRGGPTIATIEYEEEEK
ncbi:MAG: hypothetical protein PHZ04_04875 [Patescibacteria group bacterium]|nr:hypothetical protein [Patescibacteria group bacterium]MDD5294930.1 hypothetical protein [Patescibacteria group bacterium]MDD5554317.1 hypothetical protein [Patescibacteria group bacterium]